MIGDLWLLNRELELMAIQVEQYAPVLSMMKSGSLCMICRRDLSGPSGFNSPLVVSKLPQSPLFLLVLMIQPLKVLLGPLIYSRQVNFVMFSFKTAI